MLIGAVSKLSGLSKDGIRHYEAMGLIRSTACEAGSRTYRQYEAGTLSIIEKVKQAQRLGFSLKEIGPLLKAYSENPMSPDEAAKFLEQRLIIVRAKMDELREIEAFIERKLASYRKPAKRPSRR